MSLTKKKKSKKKETVINKIKSHKIKRKKVFLKR